MAREVVDPTYARFVERVAERLGVSIEVVEWMLDEEARWQLEADVAERRRRPGRRSQMLRDFCIMHEVEWYRAQGMPLKDACDKVAKVAKVAKDRRPPFVDTVRKIYEREKFPAKPLAPNLDRDWRKFLHGQTGQTDRGLRELYRRDPGALVCFMEKVLGTMRAAGMEREADDLRSRIEDLRRQEGAK